MGRGARQEIRMPRDTHIYRTDVSGGSEGEGISQDSLDPRCFDISSIWVSSAE